MLDRVFLDQLDGKIKTHQQMVHELRSLAGIKEPPEPAAQPARSGRGSKPAKVEKAPEPPKPNKLAAVATPTKPAKAPKATVARHSKAATQDKSAGIKRPARAAGTADAAARQKRRRGRA